MWCFTWSIDVCSLKCSYPSAIDILSHSPFYFLLPVCVPHISWFLYFFSTLRLILWFNTISLMDKICVYSTIWLLWSFESYNCLQNIHSNLTYSIICLLGLFFSFYSQLNYSFPFAKNTFSLHIKSHFGFTTMCVLTLLYIIAYQNITNDDSIFVTTITFNPLKLTLIEVRTFIISSIQNVFIFL